MSKKLIDTKRFSAALRDKAINLEDRKILVTNFKGSKQESDLTEPANCAGFGRIRHFRRETNKDWPQNPIPIDPACKALGLPMGMSEIRAQAFQNAVCNWRCWYCFVDFQLLSADLELSQFMSTEELVNLYCKENDRPQVIDLSGGQPDLVPEWIPWMMKTLISENLQTETYLWSDDNLSNDYFWKYLTTQDRDLISTYTNYGKVCCFKGYDEQSFVFNTLAEPEYFLQQFKLVHRLMELNIDLYFYATFTSPSDHEIQGKMSQFIDRLQEVHHNLPMRLVPLEIETYTPTIDRGITQEQTAALQIQIVALDAWRMELEKRYTDDELSLGIVEVSLN